ncbi:DnaD domain-containing protein [Bacillus sp. CGMCC 1.16607]|uniref:DnaD domain-containing protein n=1 Tax=Bacillus sp. CGMCC 1.16607 TaxID=3351842 RepID=UPI00363CE255
MDCVYSELKEVEDTSLIRYISESIQKEEIRSLFESFCEQEGVINHDRDDLYVDPEGEELNDPFLPQSTLENDNEKQQQAFHPIKENPFIHPPKKEDVIDIIKFWDNNGFGFSNLNAKEQLLAWLDDSSFLHPKQVILKAMNIACANNKRKLNYVVGILKNWENESLLTVEEIDSYQKNQKPKHKQSIESNSSGSEMPADFELDLTAGEDW